MKLLITYTSNFFRKLWPVEKCLRKTRKFQFFSTDSSSHGRGRTTPSFYTGSIKSVRSNKSATPSTGTMDQEIRNVSVNPVFKDDNKPDQLWLSNSSQMRARGLIFEQ